MNHAQDNPDLAEYFELGFGYTLRVSGMICHLHHEANQHVPVLQAGDFIAPHRYDDGEAVTGCVIDPILEQCGFMTMDEVKRVVKANCTGIHNNYTPTPPEQFNDTTWRTDPHAWAQRNFTPPPKRERKQRAPRVPAKPFIVIPHDAESVMESMA